MFSFHQGYGFLFYFFNIFVVAFCRLSSNFCCLILSIVLVIFVVISIFKLLLIPLHCILGTFPSPLENKSQAYYSSGICTQDPCNFRAVSYKLVHQDLLVARSSSLPMFLQWIPQRYNRCYTQCRFQRNIIPH